jgi:hypothetical protein
MFKSRAVAKVKPYSSCKTVLILGIGNGSLTSPLFTSLKSLIKCTIKCIGSSFFGIIKEGDAHSDAG